MCRYVRKWASSLLLLVRISLPAIGIFTHSKAFGVCKNALALTLSHQTHFLPWASWRKGYLGCILNKNRNWSLCLSSNEIKRCLSNRPTVWDQIRACMVGYEVIRVRYDLMWSVTSQYALITLLRSSAGIGMSERIRKTSPAISETYPQEDRFWTSLLLSHRIPVLRR